MSISVRDLIMDIAGVRVTCRTCGRSVVLPGQAVIRRFGLDFPVLEIAKRFRCSQCGSRDVESRPQYGAAPTEPIARHE